MARKGKSTDPNVTAHDILQAISGQPAGTTSVKKEPTNAPTKNPAAVALGRLGGVKGGKARAEKLSAKQRVDIAKKAAKSRWGKGRKE